MNRQNELYLNPQMFSTPPPNYNQPPTSKTWNFTSPPPSIHGTSTQNLSQNPVSFPRNPPSSFQRDPSPSTIQKYTSELMSGIRPSFNTAPLYPFAYVGNPSVGSVSHTPTSFPVAPPTSLAEQTNRYADYIASLYGNKGYGEDGRSSTFPKPPVTFPTTPEPNLFQHPPYPPLPSQPPPPPPQNPPPPQTPPPRSPSASSSSTQYRSSLYSSQQHSHTYSKNFYSSYKRQSDSAEDYHRKNPKKKKKPLSQNIPQKREWTMEDATRALDVEKECNKRSKNQSLIIKFPDLELNRDIVSNFHPGIENVHFQQPSTPRFCFVTLKDSADPERVIEQLNKIPFGPGHLTAEFKKDREEDLNIGPEDIDPLTLYVGNLAQEITKEDMVKCYPRQKRIDIGYAKKMKYTRYAFVSFKSVEDSIEAFQRTHASQMHSKSLIVRFRRLHGTVGMPGEPKPQSSQRTDNETPSTFISSFEENEIEDQENQSTPWVIDVSQWEVNAEIVKQEPAESPPTDEELDIKPSIPLNSRFMPGSLELAFSTHKPKIMKVESEESNNPSGSSSRKSIEIISENEDCENSETTTIKVEEEWNIRRIKKEPTQINESNTYSMLRSLNNKNNSGKRSEEIVVVVKEERMEDKTCNRINSPKNRDGLLEYQGSAKNNCLTSKEKISLKPNEAKNNDLVKNNGVNRQVMSEANNSLVSTSNGESPVQNGFSLRGNKHGELIPNTNNAENQEEASFLNISNNMERKKSSPIQKDPQPETHSDISDWMSEDIKPEPMDEDQTNDGDEDDSSDDDFNFNNFLGGIKNKTRKKKLN